MAERPCWSKMAPRGPRDPRIASKMAQDSSIWLKIAFDMHPRGLKTAPRRFQVSSVVSKDPPQEDDTFQAPKENNCFWPSRLFASDGSLRPQDGSKTVQYSPKRRPRGPQDGPKSAQERSKSGPRGPQDALLEPPRGGLNLGPLSFTALAYKIAPRGLQDSNFARSLHGLCRVLPGKDPARPCKEGTL